MDLIGTPKELIIKLVNLPNDKKYELKEHKEKRSKDANAYMWTLCNKIAQVIRSTREEVYKEAIEQVGIYEDRDYTVDEYKQKVEMWQRLGIGWFCKYHYKKNEGIITLRMYYGSSVYDTKSMSVLVDYVVNEAKELDIETMTPNEIALLKSNWK